jgi:hypothetical protein
LEIGSILAFFPILRCCLSKAREEGAGEGYRGDPIFPI